jgi:hypothetical protein
MVQVAYFIHHCITDDHFNVEICQGFLYICNPSVSKRTVLPNENIITVIFLIFKLFINSFLDVVIDFTELILFGKSLLIASQLRFVRRHSSLKN